MSSTTASASKAKSASMAASTATANAKNAAPTKMHRRSRSGCFTCRLRRKKCDEGKPLCKACKHLGLSCEYKRPMWWSNNESRRREKERIKNIIKRTKLSEKTSQAVPLANSPPSLCHSLPTSDTSASEGLGHTRAVSEDSQFDFNDFNVVPNLHQDFPQMLPPQCFHPFTPLPDFSPYEVDIKTERQTFVNDVPMRKDSTISSFSTYQVPPSSSVPSENWVQQDYFESRRESLVEDPLDFTFFDFPHGPLSPSHNAPIEVEECDQHLLDHFLNHVLRLIFPILEVNQHGSAGSDVVIPALKSNKTYLHCCLSIAALHLKATERMQGEQVDNDIMRHRYATVSELCQALELDTNHKQILEATLGMIFFQCSVGRLDDGLPDIPWHQHFQAATSLIQKMELPQHLIELNHTHGQPPFNMTLAAWIDILGSTMVGRAPVFADTYREKHLANAPAGLAELMGCEDRVMFLISEIACLEALKLDGMDEVQLCTHIGALGEQITLTEQAAGPLVSPYSQTGHIMPRQLKRNMTTVFRIATRIYLCSLVPDFERTAASITFLVDQLVDAMQYVPAGPDGFDRSLVWPLLVTGSVSTPGSSFRVMLDDRCAKLGEAADFGSFGRVREILKDTWRHNDEATARGERQNVHWRDVMRQKGWDFLLI